MAAETVGDPKDKIVINASNVGDFLPTQETIFVDGPETQRDIAARVTRVQASKTDNEDTTDDNRTGGDNIERRRSRLRTGLLLQGRSM